MRHKIYCPDLECESCTNVLSKTLHDAGANDISFSPNAVEFESAEDSQKFLFAIRTKGYRANTEPFQKPTLAQRAQDFFNNKQKYKHEYLMLRHALYTFIILFALEIMSYVAFFRATPDFFTTYAWWLLYVNLAVVSIGSAIWHFKSYKGQVTCMVGMMTGMTFGMQTGMMLGTIFGATNGLFPGGMIGMLSAVGIGYYNGKCCGIMGAMEGMMAGVMGGVMGAMIGTMFAVDNILWFMPAFMLINLAIMWGLSYMLFEEMVEGKPDIQRTPAPFWTFFSYCFIAITLLSVLMIYGPKTGLASLGGTL